MVPNIKNKQINKNKQTKNPSRNVLKVVVKIQTSSKEDIILDWKFSWWIIMSYNAIQKISKIDDTQSGWHTLNTVR